MAHFGIISPPVHGHINPLCALARELKARGHRLTYFQLHDLQSKIAAEEIDFVPIGLSAFPPGSLADWLRELGQLKGLAALRFTIGAVARTSRVVCDEVPVAATKAGVDAFIVDQMEPAGGAVAEHLRLPFVTVCSALTINRDPVAPPSFAPWPYRDGWVARLRNRLGYRVSDWVTSPITKVVASYRRDWGLPVLESPDASFSRLAQICQMPAELDFPRSVSIPNFHYVGPIRRAAARPVPFPWERLDGRPVVYASLGTLQNSREPVFRCFAEACVPLDVQLVITHGGGLTDREAAALPGQPLVVPYAPQVEVLEKASVTLTHAGLNTVLDSLTHGVPLVTVPITYEQPAIARRVEWAGAGRSLALARLEPAALRRAVKDVLGAPEFRAAANRLKVSIKAAGGVLRAADLVEAAVKGSSPATVNSAPAG